MTLESVATRIQELIRPQIAKSFVGDFPSLTSDGVAVQLSPGGDTTRYFGGATTNVYRPTVTLVARSESYATAAEWSAIARSVLEGYREGTEMAIFVEAPTEYAGRDESKLHEFLSVYRILVKE